MIDCAGKKLNVVLLAHASSTHRRLRFSLFVYIYISFPLCHPLLVASTGSDPIPRSSPAYIASCLVASSLRSPPLSSPSRRIALIPFPKMLLRRSRTSCALKLRSMRVSLSFFFYLKSSRVPFNFSRSFR